jgi:hypothetical protein
MRYGSPVTLNDRAPAPAPRGARLASHRHAKRGLAVHHSSAPDSARLTYPCKRLRMSMLAITVYNTRHMEWVFTE